jgi:hypothetical protein
MGSQFLNRHRTPGASAVSKRARFVVLTVVAIFVTLPAFAEQAADPAVHTDRTRQFNSQVNHLIAVLRDEYGMEPPHDSQVQVNDIPNYGTSYPDLTAV